MKRGLAYVFIFIGTALLFSNFAVTGAVAGPVSSNPLGIFGMFLLIGGAAFLLTIEQTQEFRVFPGLMTRASSERVPGISDPSKYFGGYVTLPELESIMPDMAKDPAYLEKIRQDYGPRLEAIRREGRMPARDADRFLRVLMGDKYATVAEVEAEPIIDRKTQAAIRTAFKVWGGEPTRQQKEVLASVGLVYNFNTHGRHGKIQAARDSDLFIVTSKTPSDWRTGRNLASDAIDLVRRIRQSRITGRVA